MKIRHGLLLALPALLPAAASAARITNMDTIPYDLQVTLGEENKTISINPNQTWETTAYPVFVYVHKKRVELQPDGSYAIWKGGTFTQQNEGIEERKSH